MVLCVDEEKGYIDFLKRYVRIEVFCSYLLLFRRVFFEDVEVCEIKFNKSKVVYFIIRYVLEMIGMFFEILYKVYCV